MSKYEIAITRIEGLPDDDTGEGQPRAVRQEIFRQSVDTLDLQAVIRAINNLSPGRKRKASTKGKESKA